MSAKAVDVWLNPKDFNRLSEKSNQMNAVPNVYRSICRSVNVFVEKNRIPCWVIWPAQNYWCAQHCIDFLWQQRGNQINRLNFLIRIFNRWI